MSKLFTIFLLLAFEAHLSLTKEVHPCNRPCVKGEKPKTCEYQFTLEYYRTMGKTCGDCPNTPEDCFLPECISADGHERSVITINRQLPGPAIEVCQGDRVVVDVVNALLTETTTIHWHGQHQEQAGLMDGVPMVTQCPIPPYTSFRYNFIAGEAGTSFWHSHVGMQRHDGVFGPLIVRQPKEDDPLAEEYDQDLSEHVILFADWCDTLGDDKFTNLLHGSGGNKPDSMIVNGLGRRPGDEVPTPIARILVQKGQRYRIRLINAGVLNCPTQVSVDNHMLHVVSSDGSDIEPVEAKYLNLFSGERFDFILNADQPEGLYWIRFKGLMDCAASKILQPVVLEYTKDGTSSGLFPKTPANYDDELPSGLLINPINVGTEDTSGSVLLIPQLSSKQSWDSSLTDKPDVQLYMTYDFHSFSGPKPRMLREAVVNTPQFNHITMQIPSLPLLSQRDQLPEGIFCNRTTIGEECEKEQCICPYVVQVKKNAIVEMIFVDEGQKFNSNHPIHMHGYEFRVVALERLGNSTTEEEVKKWDAAGKIKRNLVDAPSKDTVTVPDGGYTVIRFNATNPGYWILHCHLGFHAELGMAFVVKVGEHEDMEEVPDNFPQCGNYLPSY